MTVQETGLYYLQSRYYNPEWGRFINADDVDLLGANDDFNSYNLFAYCGNNPISRKDDKGYLWGAIVGAAIGGAVAGALISTVSYLATSGNDRTFSGALAAMCSGAFSGAIGGIAGALGGPYAIGGSIVVGLFNGTVTAYNTEGSLETKLLAGGATAVMTGCGTYLGTKIYTPTDNAFVAGVSAYAGGLFIGAPTELLNVAVNQGVNKISTSTNNAPVYDVRRHLRAERVFG